MSAPRDNKMNACSFNGFSGRRSRAFTLIELLVVISIIALLASLIVGGTRYAGAKMRESRIRAELNALVSAIESYKADIGFYPPDNVVSRNPLVVNPVTNALFYELTGTVVSNDTFVSRSGSEAIGTVDARQFFGVDGFANHKKSPSELHRPFIQLKSGQFKEISSPPGPDVEVLAVPVGWPLNRADQPTRVKGLNPWRYVSTSPTNNPQSFDLWAEYVEGKKVKIICNWSRDIIEKP
jgi:prepilin-type N-terminal cleavage/methylation domain-containing protein